MKNFLTSVTDSVYTVSNIRFEIDGKDASKRLMKVQPQEVINNTDWGYTEQEATIAFVRSQLFYGNITVLYDFKLAYRDERKQILAQHKATVRQPWSADITDKKDWHTSMDDCYKVSWPATWYCVVPSDYSCYLDSDTCKKLADQLVYEYLLETLPITIE